MSSHKSTTPDQRNDSATSLLHLQEERLLFPSAGYHSSAYMERTSPAVRHLAPKPPRVTQADKCASSHLPHVSTLFYEQPDPYRYRDIAVPTIPSSSTSPLHTSAAASSSCVVPSISKIATGNTLCCGQCGVEFTGRYRRGNLARHARLKHAEATKVPLICSANGCSRPFARQDARLKHERKHHPELRSSSRVENSYRRIVSRAKNEAKVFSVPPQQGAYTINVDEVPRSVRVTVCRMYTQLDNETYTRLHNMFFTLLERMIQYLRDTRSDTYDAYLKVLKDMSLVVDAIDSGSIDPIHQEMADTRSPNRPSEFTEAAGSCKGKGSVPNFLPTDTLRPKSTSHAAGKRTANHRDQGNLKVAKSNRAKTPSARKVDCPDRKHWLMNPNSQASPCSGCGVTVMSQVRNHLNRVYHPGRSGAWQCRNCKRDFDNEDSLNAHMEAKSCQHQIQCRGDIVKEWARLYLARHSEAVSIPSPFCDENEWLTHDIWEEAHASILDSSTSFLDQQGYAEREPDHNTSHFANVISDEPNPGAVQFTLDIYNELASRISNHPNGASASGAAVSFTNDTQPSRSPQSHHTMNHPLSIIYHNTAQYFGTLAEAALYAELDQIRALANGAAMAVDFTNIPLQQQLLQGHTRGLENSDAAPNQPREYFYGSSNTAMPHGWSRENHWVQHEFSQTPSINYCAPIMSRRSSRADLGTVSSQAHFPTQTNSSFVYEPTENSLLSPITSPRYYRRMSQGTMFSDYDTSQRMLPELMDLPAMYSPSEDPRHVDTKRHTHIDPRLLDQPADYFAQQDGNFHAQERNGL